MNMATKLGVRRTGIASRVALAASLLVALALALPAGASAEQNCVGHIAKLAATDEDSFPVEYKFLCYEPIKGFALGGTAEMSGFGVTADVFAPDGTTLDPNDRFAECEGEVPGFGFACAGAYTAKNKLITGQFTLSTDPCIKPRPSAWVVAEANTTAAKLAGPFDLGRPRGCPKVSKSKPAAKKKSKKSKH